MKGYRKMKHLGEKQKDNSYIVQMQNGTYHYHLATLMTQKNISINQLMRDTGTDFKVIKRIMTGSIVRIDTDVLARLCDYFKCSITDIIEYTPNLK